MCSPIMTGFSGLPHSCDNQIQATDSQEAECLSQTDMQMKIGKTTLFPYTALGVH